MRFGCAHRRVRQACPEPAEGLTTNELLGCYTSRLLKYGSVEEWLLVAADEKTLDIIHHATKPRPLFRGRFPFRTRWLRRLLQLS